MVLAAQSVAAMANPALSDEQVLSEIGATGASRIGAGGEAQVYALPGNRVARIMRSGARVADAETRAALLREIAGSAATLSFRTPAVQSVSMVGERVVTIEERLPGEPVSDLLGRLTGDARRRLLADYLDTATRIRQAKVTRPYFGPLIGDRALRVGSWSEFARARLARNLRRCPAEFRAALRSEMGTAWREPSNPAIVHLDYFPPNVLAEGDGITAVLDFGPSAVIGDPDMEAWSAVAYLDAEISPQATDADRRLAMEWLTERGLVDDYAKARRWLAASWTHATDDPSLDVWCRRVLLDGS
ncbi:phosphotransferase family protein [Devosia sp. SL43]|uniref:phosphotransferase family protein n=1 Tax=Devosia sp. SL43 TaxID=2806348 RepID=UPI001F1F8BA1|nr:aminoglycoside phosphotransferase family protein [Devosia sp. SL43]UJW85298.1 aminoglycoside phosphotransferase family protein [Devosia sp. SL43]